MIALSPTEMRLGRFLSRNAGKIISYAELDRVVSCMISPTNLRTAIWRLRRKGLDIENVRGQGYRVAMPVIDLDYDTQVYAQEIEATVRTTMGNHAETVGFESQIAIIGVVIGALLEQLPDRDRKHFTNILIQNVKNAKKYSVPMQMQ